MAQKLFLGVLKITKAIFMKIYPQIRHTLYRLKQDFLHKIDPSRCKYTLLEKTQKINIDQYKKLSSNSPAEADSFTYVTIGKRDDNKFRKKITTFYSGNNIVERLFESTDGERIIREYEHRGHDVKNSNCRYRKITQKCNTSGDNGFFTELIKEIRTYKSEKTGYTKLEIIKNEINGNKIIANITEYPFNGKKNNKLNLPRKILGVILDFENGIPNITGTFETPNVKFPVNDKYLAFRFILDNKLKLTSLTKFFIQEKKLDKLGIKIEIKDDIGKNTSGYFSELENKIAYKTGTTNFVDLSAHEVEHAYQYRQIGRIGKGYSEYGRKSLKYYGKIDGIKEGMEAHKYTIASANYPELKDDEDLSKNMEYMNNYLEVKAREAGERAQKEYNELGKEINKQFFFGLQ